MKQAELIAPLFEIEGSVRSIAPIGNGHINDTLRVATDRTSYILQRINHSIFGDVALLQQNTVRITEHIRGILRQRGEKDIDRKVLTVVPTKDGKTFVKDGENYWRMTLEIGNSTSYDTLTPPLAKATGAAFGDFQKMLSSIPEGSIGATIENFHNIAFRIGQLNDALKSDPAGRAAGVRELSEALLSRSGQMLFAERLNAQGLMPKRITHCDTKVNNVLFDRDSGELLCVIDLDTTMPGYVLADYGDFIRTAGCTAAEDEPDTSKIGFAQDIFESFTEGYLCSAAEFLTECEKDNLARGAALMTYMQAVRFLTDYIAGVTYYKIAYPEHNLVRARAQYAHLLGIESRLPEMQRFIDNCLNNL